MVQGQGRIDVDQTPREVAFCDHAIRTPTTPLVGSDATRDLRFAENPLVTGDPGDRHLCRGAAALVAESEP